MAATGLLALLDDIASILDDVALLTKAATRKTVGVLGDDLALNAQQVAGVRAERELPVVWAVAKGSAVNKAILVPAALAISAFAPWAVTPLLMIGGAYLAYEGFEKVAHRLLHDDEDDAEKRALREGLADPAADFVALEKTKIRGAIRTDFILSAEIIVIALGLVADAPFPTRVAVMVGVAVLMTIGVYGIVAAIVKLDDAGLWLCRREGPDAWSRFQCALGSALLALAPRLMQFLGVAGTVAMFLVGGGILVHGIPALAHALEPHGMLVSLAGDLATGAVAGAVIYGVVALVRRVVGKK
jgi:predicted DNA repair protein MutK